MNLFELSLISKNRAQIMGWAIFLVLLSHVDAFTWPQTINKILPHICSIGSIGVELFLFVSGIGLYYSFKKNNLFDYYKKRFLRIIPEYLLIAGIGFGIIVLLSNQTTYMFFYRFSTMSVWRGDRVVWYIPFILICYLVYPFLRFFIYNKSYLIISLIIVNGFLFLVSYYYPKLFSNIEQLLTRIPVFLLGCYYGKKVFNDNFSPQWYWRGGILIFVVLRVFKIVLLGGSSLQIGQILIRISNLFLSLFFIWLICKYSINNIFLSFLGKISFELYLCHLFLIHIWNLLPLYNGVIVYYIIIIPISIFISYIIHKYYERLLCQKRSIN